YSGPMPSVMTDTLGLRPETWATIRANSVSATGLPVQTLYALWWALFSMNHIVSLTRSLMYRQSNTVSCRSPIGNPFSTRQHAFEMKRTVETSSAPKTRDKRRLTIGAERSVYLAQMCLD